MFAFTLKAALGVGLARTNCSFWVLLFLKVLIQLGAVVWFTPRHAISPALFQTWRPKVVKFRVGQHIQIRKFMTTSVCTKILIIFILPQSCQRTLEENFPAGTADTTFSVDSEDNVVITYGASKGPDNLWRYFATLSSNQSLRSGERVKE